MGALEANGRIEAARTDAARATAQLCAEIQEQIGLASAGVQEFGAVAKLGGAIASRSAMDKLDGTVDRIRDDIARLAAHAPAGRAPVSAPAGRGPVRAPAGRAPVRAPAAACG